MNEFTTIKIRKDLAIELKTHAIEKGITLQDYIDSIFKHEIGILNSAEEHLEEATLFFPEEETKIVWTKEQLEEQKEEILSEFNFHEVADFCDNQETKPYIKYDSIAKIRQEAREILDDFIDQYLEGGFVEIYTNGKWNVVMSISWDGETPLMELSFRYQVSNEVDACMFGEKWKEENK